MSYADTTRLLSSKLMQPSKVAILTSVGFHALLLGIALPKIDWSNPNKSNEGIVPIIQLNTIEQTRLPDTLVEPELDIPAFPNTPINNNPLLNFPSVVELDQDAIAKIPPSPPPIKYIPQYVPPATPPQTNQLPNSPTQTNLPPLPPPIDIKTNNPPQTTENSPNDANLTPSFPPSQVQASSLPPPSSTENQQSDIQQSNTAAANTDSLDQQSDGELDSNDIATAKEQKYQNLLAQLRNKQQSLRYEVNNTSDKEYRDNYLQFAQAVNNPEIESISIEAAYPKDACIQKMEGTSIYGAMVDANGQVTNLELLQNSGYAALNQQASEAINSKTFTNQTGQPKPYEVSVKFEYQPDACPSIYSEYSDQNQKTQPPTTTTTGEVAPQPAAENEDENTQPASTPNNNQENNSSVDSTSSETKPLENNTPSQSEDSTVTNEDSDNQVKPQTEAEVNNEASQTEQNLPVINQDNNTPPTEVNTPQTQPDNEDSATSDSTDTNIESTEETRPQPNQNSGVKPQEDNQQDNQSNSQTETELENNSQPSDTEASTTVPDSWGKQPIRVDGQN